MSDLSTEHLAPVDRRIEELGRIIMAYSEVTEKLQVSHDRLEKTVCQLRNELSEKNRQLERRKRLAALGEMAAGMAHEIRNPLGGIQLYASLLLKDLSDRSEAHGLVQKIAGGVKRLDGVVSQVLSFAREIRPQFGPVELPALVEEAVSLAGLGDGIDMRVDGPASLTVEVDSTLLGQAILNLVRNASEAMDGRGSMALRFGPPGDGVEARQFYLVVEDSGPGIPPGVLDRIFNPFFTTRDHGTGLGLAIVHRIVEAHDGSITACNREGSGARFEIRI